MLKRLTNWASRLFNDKEFATIVTNLVLLTYLIVLLFIAYPVIVDNALYKG